jgi:hypothetical protein
MQHVRWSYSFAGEEFGRMYSWGNDPEQKVFKHLEDINFFANLVHPSRATTRKLVLV